ncbi:MAG TPA: glycosyltransferase family 1 protein [Deltaproteobacteria bacterium]|nr:glycosyltransferase family 1 protein [Deltaproteobacteria bacterium]
MTQKNDSRPLKICLLTYRGNPTCGGQGVYIKHLSKALADIGHEVEVISGPPYPHLDEKVRLHKLPSLDLYNTDHFFRPEKFSNLLNPLNMYEFLNMCAGSFPEPYTFSQRAYKYLREKKINYDIVHDNQCLAYGIGEIARELYPTIATIHHPITVDRREEYKAAQSIYQKFKIYRWYTFIDMQLKVARRLSHIITVSDFTRKDIAAEFSITEDKIRVVHNGINNEYFYPVENGARPENTIIVTNSADVPLKGLKYLLEAVARIRKNRPVKLTVIGEPKKDGVIQKQVEKLGIGDIVHFTGRIANEDFADYYAKSAIAVVPSLYEGFGIPALEAMASGVPLITSSGGALPEVVGEAGMIVPPADASALAGAITYLLNNPEERKRYAKAGLDRVASLFSWSKAAREVTSVYREAIDAYRRL